MNGATLAAIYKPPTLFERAKAITRKYSGSLFVASDAYCYSDSGGTTPATQDGVVGYWKDLIGTNHATQGTTANKPLLRKGAKNWLLNTATLSTQNVTTIARSYTLSFTGTGTVTLTGTSSAGPLVGTGENDRVSLTFTPTAGTLTLTVSGSVTNAMLEYGAVFTGYGASGATSASNGSGNWWVDFDGSNDYLSMANYFSPAANESQGSSVAAHMFAADRVLIIGNSQSAALYAMLHRTSAITQYILWNTSAGLSLFYGTSPISGYGVNFVSSAYRNGTTQYVRLNAVANGSDSTSIGTISNATKPVIGSFRGTADFMSGGIYGVGYWAGEPSSGEIYLIEKYLGNLAGVVL